VAYAFVTKNMFVLVSNLPGLVLSVWLNVGAAKLQYIESLKRLHDGNEFESSHSLRLDCNNNDNGDTEQIRNGNHAIDSNTVPVISQNQMLPSSTRQEHLLISILILWGVSLTTVVFVPMSNKRRALIIGTIVNLNLIVFYGAPLSTIAKVFKTRSSRSIHRRTLGKKLLTFTFNVSK
jgi:solute carrier family 50 protein (sugar transporter)